MGNTKRRYSNEEIVKRGEAIFETDVKPHLKGRDPMEFVLIDIETNRYEIDADEADMAPRGSQRKESDAVQK